MRKATLSVVALLALLALSASWAQAQTFTLIDSFSGVSPLGSPLGLLRDKEGNFYVSAEAGNGVMFKLDTSGNVTVLHTFTDQPDGAGPLGSLVRDKEGNLYGTTIIGGSAGVFSGNGTVFKLDASGNETVLHNFNFSDGSAPFAGLVRDKEGNLYGTTSQGGANGLGTVFKVDTSGNETVLHSFALPEGIPLGGLVMDKEGNFYGTTSFGTVFKLDASGNETVLFSFSSFYANGSQPNGDLVRDKEGNLYGVTFQGGANGWGTVFKLDTAGHETVLHSFTNAPDGAFPFAGLVRDKEGNLYGTTSQGGANRLGTVFKVDTSGNETVLHTFTGADGDGPFGGLIMDKRGNLYGTTQGGGPAGGGVIFELVP